MFLFKLLFVGACLCSFSKGSAAKSNLQSNLDPHVAISDFKKEQIKPVILKFRLYKDEVFVKSCYGAHVNIYPLRLVNWIMPAECLDKTKYDMIEVKHGYKEGHHAKLCLKDIYIRIHPNYNDATKSHNIGIVCLDRQSYMDPESGYTHAWLPLSIDNLDNKILEVYGYKSMKSDIDGKEKVSLYSINTKRINTVWCKILYPFSPIKKHPTCTSALSGKGLSKDDDLGAPLITRNGNTFQLIGLATNIRPWTNLFSLPIEFLSIRPYLNWITFGTSGFTTKNKTKNS